MKKVIFWVFSALVLVFSSCGKNDDNSNPTNLTGTWVVEKAIFGGEQVPIIRTCFNKSTIVFTENTMTIRYFDGDDTSACSETKEERNYQFTDNKLYATEGDVSVEIGHLEGGKLYITNDVLPKYLPLLSDFLVIDIAVVFRKK